MRDFLNEDEIALLKETCLSGQLEASKEIPLSLCDPMSQAFKIGVIDTLKECFNYRNFSSISRIAEQACNEIEQILALPYGDDFRKEQMIAFLRGKGGQVRFILDRLVALRCVKNTLDSGNSYFIPGEHLAFVEIWRRHDLGPFIDLHFSRNALS